MSMATCNHLDRSMVKVNILQRNPDRYRVYRTQQINRILVPSEKVLRIMGLSSRMLQHPSTTGAANRIRGTYYVSQDSLTCTTRPADT